jgi:hypothetical protein
MTRTAKTANGRTRTLNTNETGIDGSGRKVWIVWTLNENGSVHHRERFHSESEAVAWFLWS